MAHISGKLIETTRDAGRRCGLPTVAAERGLSFEGKRPASAVAWTEVVTYLERLTAGMSPEEIEAFGRETVESNAFLMLGARVLPTPRVATRVLWRAAERVGSHLSWTSEVVAGGLLLRCELAPEVPEGNEPFFRIIIGQLGHFPVFFGAQAAPVEVRDIGPRGLVAKLALPATALDRALEAGRRVLDRASSELVELLRTEYSVATDGSSVPPELLAEKLGLTFTETRIALLLADGLDLKEIARELEISVHTVRSHLRAAYAKTGANSQARLVGLVLREIGSDADR
tara:strand:+ start:1189 stop:2046 length:858 start_codon:yes stop_codon:yes gene_type:complete